jgi:hypothetical protein
MSDDYQNLLKKIEKNFNKFIEIAKKVKPEDKSIEMISAKSKAMISCIELKALLNKYRNSK